jgi:hypothetical protein
VRVAILQVGGVQSGFVSVLHWFGSDSLRFWSW